MPENDVFLPLCLIGRHTVPGEETRLLDPVTEIAAGDSNYSARYAGRSSPTMSTEETLKVRVKLKARVLSTLTVPVVAAPSFPRSLCFRTFRLSVVLENWLSESETNSVSGRVVPPFEPRESDSNESAVISKRTDLIMSDLFNSLVTHWTGFLHFSVSYEEIQLKYWEPQSRK